MIASFVPHGALLFDKASIRTGLANRIDNVRNNGRLGQFRRRIGITLQGAFDNQFEALVAGVVHGYPTSGTDDIKVGRFVAFAQRRHLELAVGIFGLSHGGNKY